MARRQGAEDGIEWSPADNLDPLNILGRDTFAQLNTCLAELEAHPNTRVIILSGKSDGPSSAGGVRVAVEETLLGFPEVRIGIPSVIEAYLLPCTIGLGRARQMLLLGNPVNAEEALKIGLVDRVVAPEEVISAVTDLAKDFLGMSRDGLASQKAIVAKWVEVSEEESNEFRIQELIKLFKTPRPKEVMEAYLEKRPPCI